MPFLDLFAQFCARTASLIPCFGMQISRALAREYLGGGSHRDTRRRPQRPRGASELPALRTKDRRVGFACDRPPSARPHTLARRGEDGLSSGGVAQRTGERLLAEAKTGIRSSMFGSFCRPHVARRPTPNPAPQTVSPHRLPHPFAAAAGRTAISSGAPGLLPRVPQRPSCPCAPHARPPTPRVPIAGSQWAALALCGANAVSGYDAASRGVKDTHRKLFAKTMCAPPRAHQTQTLILAARLELGAGLPHAH